MYVQLVNHGISEELLERVKKVCSQCYKEEREDNFNKSTPVKRLTELLEKKKNSVVEEERLENVDWEDVFTLFDDTEWHVNTPCFK